MTDPQQQQQPDEPTAGAARRGAGAARLATDLAKGASRGGVAGVAAAAGLAALRNRRTRKLILGIVAVAIGIPALLAGLGVFSAIAVGQAQQAKQQTQQHAAERSSSVSDDELATSLRQTAGTIVPQTIYAAVVKNSTDDVDVSRLASSMQDAGIDASNNDPAAGAVAHADGTLRMGESAADKNLAEKTQQRFVRALVAYGLDDQTAGTVFATARQWALGAANVCAAESSTVDTPDDQSAPSSGGGSTALTGEQTANAKVIIGVARSVFGDGADGRRASIVGIATALQESGLRNINYGDGDSLGLFQQRANWGTAEQRRTPAYAAAKFYLALQRIPGWQQLDVTVAAQKVQISAFPDAYAKWTDTATSATSTLWADAPPVPVPASAGGTGSSSGGSGSSSSNDDSSGDGQGGDSTCATSDGGTVGEVSGSVRDAARALLPSFEANQLTFLDNSSTGPAAQIRAAAAGTSTENCTVHLGALQAIQVAVSTFGSVQVSSLNRACSGAVTGSNFGTSPHSANGGGRAVDFSGFGGRVTVGSDANAVKYLQALLPFAPGGNILGVGQVQCRAGAGSSIALPGVRQFNDYCNHVHVDFGNVGDHTLKGSS